MKEIISNFGFKERPIEPFYQLELKNLTIIVMSLPPDYYYISVKSNDPYDKGVVTLLESSEPFTAEKLKSIVEFFVNL